MIYVLETEIADSTKLRKSLKNIYGLGKKRSNLICKKLGIAENLQTSQLINKQIYVLTQYIENSKILLSNNLKKENNLNFQRLVNIKSYRGLRKLKKLPVRGQRTHTNAKIAKKK